MNNVKEIKKGFIDLYHGKAKANGNDKAPDFEGQVKLSDGTIIRAKLWKELRENVTNNERFSGYIYQIEKSEE